MITTVSACAYPTTSTTRLSGIGSILVARDRDGMPWSQTPIPLSLLTQQTLRTLDGQDAKGRALDIGAGEGSDAIRLAKLGYDVDAVEVSTVGAKKIECFAEEVGVRDKLRVFSSDIQVFQPDGPYDVVICNGVLHYIEGKQSVIELMQQETRPGGINIVSLLERLYAGA